MSGGTNLGVPGTRQLTSLTPAHRRKDSSPSARFWESPDTLAQLDVVRQWIGKHYKKYVLVDAPSCQALATVTLQLLQFQEDAFGKQAVSPTLTKLPAQCFLDLRPGGGLCHILGTAYKFKAEQGWRRFDLQNPSRTERNVEMFGAVEKTLIQELCGMREVRKNHGMAVVNNRIYAVGGQGPMGGLDSVEYYDIVSNEWRAASAMPWRGVTVKCAAVGDVIYVLAGFQGVGRLGHVLEYHTDTERWVTCSKVRAFPVTSCLICVVDTCGVNEDEDMDLIDSVEPSVCCLFIRLSLDIISLSLDIISLSLDIISLLEPDSARMRTGRLMIVGTAAAFGLQSTTH